ncbi:MAG: ribosome-associated ATPase/putative transporter RbbA [Afipia sp.]|nr:ribosome-associated ATPase/putative transporter RbbA [Afipia sp.]
MSPTEDNAIEVSSVTHRYGGVAALADVSLVVPCGTATAFVGPDGVGKSTLLALIAGVKRLQSGTIRTLDGDIASRTHRDRIIPRIAYMPQGLGRNLYPSLSVEENIDYFGRLFGQPLVERQARIARLLDATGLSPFLDRPAGKLSGGMKQKLSLCCSLIHDPDLLVLDEPTTGLDPLSRRQFWTLIDEIKAERPGVTVLVATAYMEEAQRFDRLVAVDAGRVLAAGRMADILAQAGAATLEAAYVALRGHSAAKSAPVISPRVETEEPPVIEAHGLTRRFGDFTAVDHVSFSIKRGEIFGFLGSNGCGKTVTIKMLTGLIDITEGSAELLGRPVEASDLKTRMRVGYVSQSFSLYEELTVRADLDLHARLYRVPAGEIEQRIDNALQQFDLRGAVDQKPSALPLGIRQRLQLAAACLHRPELLILDEPTSGVDPEARDMFWRLLYDLSRRDGVTVFISTHFMNEAERCDRISLMHAGKVLAMGRPEELRAARAAATLEDAFVSYLEEAAGAASAVSGTRILTNVIPVAADTVTARRNDDLRTSAARIWSVARREMLELMRDPVRLAVALLAPLILMMIFSYGITFDVEKLSFAVFDRDQSRQSGELIESFSGSRYFQQQAALWSEAEIDQRLRTDVRMVISIPPGFGRALLDERKPEVAFFLDGAMPFRAETIRGYVQGIVLSHVTDLARRTSGGVPRPALLKVEPRFRYNQDFRSVFALTPGVVMILLLVFPAMLTALGVVREREIGSISNLYASPATIGEFLLGKQAPYVVLGFTSFLTFVIVAGLLFGVQVKGSAAALALAALLYVFAATALGILVSTFVRTQVAAIIGTTIFTVVPGSIFSGFIYPAAALEGPGRVLGMGFPSLWFQNVSLGTFAKARDFADFYPEYLILFAFGLGFLLAASLLLRKQET